MTDLSFDHLIPNGGDDLSFDHLTPAGYAADVLRKFKQGAALGFGDEASGALKATFGGRGAEGRTWIDRYQNARDYERRMQEKASNEAPVSSEIAEMAGSVAPSMLLTPAARAIGAVRGAAATTLPALPGAAVPAARSALGGLGEAMGTGALVGAVQGVGDTEDIKNAPLAALLGGAVGSLGGAAGYGLGRVTQAATRFTNTAPRVAPAMSTEDLKNAAQAGYDRFENAGGLFTQQGLNDLAASTRQTLADMGWQPELGPKVQAFNRAMERARGGNVVPTATSLLQTATPKQIQNLRNIAGKIRASNDPNESRYGSALIDEIDNFLANIQPGQYAAPPGGAPASQISADLAEANRMWQQYAKADAVDQAFTKAENRAASTYSGGNENNAIRQELRRIWEKRGERGFTPDENAAFSTAVRGGRFENIARGLGKLAPSRGGLSTWANIGAGAGTGGATLPLTALAEGMKLLGDRATRRNLEEVGRVIRAGGRRRPVAPPPNALEEFAVRFPQLFAGPVAQGITGLLGP